MLSTFRVRATRTVGRPSDGRRPCRVQAAWSQPAVPAWRRSGRRGGVGSGRRRRGSRAMPRGRLGALRAGLGTRHPNDRMKRRLGGSYRRGRNTDIQCRRDAIAASCFAGQRVVPIARITGRRRARALILQELQRTAPGAQGRDGRRRTPRIADRMAHGGREQAHQDQHDADPADPSLLRSQPLHGGDCGGLDRAGEKKPGMTAGLEGTWKADFHEVPRRQPVTQPVCTDRALE